MSLARNTNSKCMSAIFVQKQNEVKVICLENWLFTIQVENIKGEISLANTTKQSHRSAKWHERDIFNMLTRLCKKQ